MRTPFDELSDTESPSLVPHDQAAFRAYPGHAPYRWADQLWKALHGH